jgi:hypothetical protein
MEFTRKGACTLACMLLIFISACKDELTHNTLQRALIVNKQNLQQLTLAEQYAYLDNHLSTLANGILGVTDDRMFRNQLYQQIEKRFDGDYNTLLTVLNEKIPGLYKQLSASPYTNADAFNVSLEAFTGIPDSSGEVNLYPQLYIPNYTQLKAKGMLNSNPTVVWYNGDEARSWHDGIRLNVLGKPETVRVDEDYTRNNEVWVVSLSESYHGGDIVYLPQEPEPVSSDELRSVCLAPSYCQASNKNWQHGKMRNLRLNCDYDNIFSGSNDIADNSYCTFPRNINPFNGSRVDPQWIGNSDHRMLRKANPGYCYAEFTKMFFEEWRTAGTNPPNHQGKRGNLAFFVLFEFDNWPARLKSKDVVYTEYGIQADGSWGMIDTKLTIMYRSSQSALASGVMDSTDGCDGKLCDNQRHPCVYRVQNDCFEAQFSTE